MELQEFLIKVIDDNKDARGINYFSRTDILKIGEKPAVVVTEEPKENAQVSSSAKPAFDNQECTMFILLDQKNTNDISEDDFKTVRNNLGKLNNDIIADIITAVRSENGFADLRIGKSTPDIMIINAGTCDVMTIPISATIAKSN